MKDSLLYSTILALLVRRVVSSVKPELIFHFISPGAAEQRRTVLDIGMETKIDHLTVCRTPGNKLTVRIGPKEGSTELIDENQGLSNDSVGAKSCLDPLVSNPVKCTSSNFCTLDNHCVATLLIPCTRRWPSHGWKAIQYVDVTISQHGGDLEVSRCFAICRGNAAVDENDLEDNYELTETAVGLIVAGVVAAASFIVAGLVIWMMRKHHNLPQTNA